MAKVNVVFYGMYGHVWRMARAVAEGASAEVDGVEAGTFPGAGDVEQGGP